MDAVDLKPKPKGRSEVDVLGEMVKGQAITIARLTAIIENTMPALRAELDAALAELAKLKAPAEPSEPPKE